MKQLRPNVNLPVRRFSLRLYILLFSLIFFSTQTIAQCSRAADSLVLVALYTATGGANWTNKWVLTTPLNTWQGVKLNTSGCVKNLILPSNNLNGILPTLLGNLSALDTLILNNNILTGQIPTQLGNLSLLSNLDLSYNKFSGSIPNQIGNLTKLQNLNLGNNQLTGAIPTQLGNLILLRILNLGSNQLTGQIPTTLGSLTQLIELTLSANLLTGGIPTQIGSLTQLRGIYFSGNQLTGTVPPLNNLSFLQYLYLNGNLLDSLPNQNPIRPYIVNSSNNNFTFDDIIPNLSLSTSFNYNPQASVYKDTTVALTAGSSYTLDLRIDYGITNSVYTWNKNGVFYRTVTGSPRLPLSNITPSDAGLYTCTVSNPSAPLLTLTSKTITLNVTTTCRYTDSLALVALYNATAGANWIGKWVLTQPMTTWYGVTLTGTGCVSSLFLNNNNLVGTLPIEIGSLSQLTALYLQGNQLSGSIPTQLGNLSLLTFLVLQGNQLSGTIPTTLGNLTQLKNLYLNINQLTGSIPIQLGNLTQLVTLFLDNNQLTGTIPTQLGNLTQLINLGLSSNSLSGSIPTQIGSLTQLQTLVLNTNQLTGSIPTQIGSLPQLKTLNLASNQLTGTIPTQLGSLPQLTTLALQFNQLTGMVPTQIANLAQLSVLYLNNNLLDSIPNLNPFRCQNVNFSNNKFTFDDLAPNSNITVGAWASASFSYNPQDSVSQEKTLTANTGTNLTLDLGIDYGMTNSIYQWYKDGVAFRSVTGTPRLTLTGLTTADAGVYTCQITNSVFPIPPQLNGSTENTNLLLPSLILYSRKIIVVIHSCAATITGNNTFCQGFSTVITASGGVNYQWNTGASTASISVNSAGTYTVTATDAFGCKASATYTVTARPLPTASHTKTDTHVGVNDGKATITALSGTPPYSITLKFGVTIIAASSQTATQFNYTNLAKGVYLYTVTDLYCTSFTYDLIIGETTCVPMTATITPTHITCNGMTNGSATANIVGGTSPYTYKWSNNATTSTINGLGVGSYLFTVTDAQGCTAPASTTITQPTALSASTSVVNPQCNGTPTGSATVVPTGGTAPYTYKWSYNNATTATISNIPAGVYTVTVTDAANCAPITKTVTLTDPLLFVAMATPTNVTTVGGSNGTISFSYMNGTPNYSIILKLNTTTITQASTIPPQYINLAKGTYQFTVTDGNGCISTGTTTINDPSCSTITVSITSTTIPCFGGTGSVTASAIGGTTPYVVGWNNGATSPTISNLTAGTYTATMTDAQGCTGNASITITQPAALSASTSVVNPKCKGTPTGSATVVPAGGTAPYTYKWSYNNATTATISNIPAGVYTVTVTDAANCAPVTKTVTLTDPLLFVATATPTNVTTVGGSNGTISFSYMNGMPNYSIILKLNTTTITQASTTPPQYINLAKGTYRFTVTDGNGCFSTDSVTLSDPNCNLGITMTSGKIACNGDTTTVTATVLAGTAPYSYTWSNGFNQTSSSSTVSNNVHVKAGVYTVTVTDGVGCTVPQSFPLTEPALLVISPTQANIVTVGGSNGKIGFVITGGTTPYTKVLTFNGTTVSPAQIPEPSFQYTNLSKGTYLFTVTDANGCIQTSTVTLVEPTCGMTLNMSKGDIRCPGEVNGSAYAFVFGGLFPFNFKWNTGVTSNLGTSSSLTSLVAGVYTVTVTDGAGCSISQSVTVNPVAAFNAAQIIKNVSCFGLSDGQIITNMTGGTPPYRYLWSNGATTPTISNLTAGNYTLTLTDSKPITDFVIGCRFIQTFTVTEPQILNVTPTKLDITMVNGSDGKIGLNITGGTQPYTKVLTLNGTTILETQTTPPQYNNLSKGKYIYTVTDANGCSKTDSIILIEPSCTLRDTMSSGKIACSGGTTTVTTTVLSGATPYRYAWSNGFSQASSANTASNNVNVKAGINKVTVTDGVGCTVVDSVILTEPPLLVVTPTQTNITTIGGSDGKISLNITGGTPTYTPVLTLNGTAITPTQTIPPQYNGLSKGTYAYTVTDANGCIVTASNVIMSDPTCNLRDTMRFGKIACNGGTTTVTATVLSGATPYRYAWSNGFNQAVSASTVSNNVNVKAGIHKVTVTDRVGCVVVDSVIVTEPPLLVVAITQSDITTLNGSEGKIGFVITGGTLPYTRVLTLNGTAIPPTQTTPPQYNNLSKGIYAYTVTDANGCTKTGTIVLNESACLSGIEKANAGLDIIECNKTTSSLKANPIQNTIRVTGKWSVLRGTATISSPTTAQTAVANLSQGSNLFVWTLTDSICSFFSKDTVAIFVEPKPQLQNAYYSLNANARQMLINIQDILSKTMANPTAVQIFPHQISSNLGKVVVQNSQSILYTVENFVGGSTVEVPLKVCSQVCPNLCDSATLFITVNIIDNGIDLVIPQVFATDYSFALTLMEIGNLEWYPANQMTIVDRWGGTVFGPVVYKNKTAEQAWDGTKHGQRLPTGAYYYYITYLDNRILRIKRGIIYLIDKE